MLYTQSWVSSGLRWSSNLCPPLSLQLGSLIEQQPLLHTDKSLRLFAYMVKGDVDGELDPVPARQRVFEKRQTGKKCRTALTLQT